MGEPLKDKGRIHQLCYVENALNCYKGLCEDCSSKNFVYNHEDKEIKSALEWLDKNIDKIAPRHKPLYYSTKEARNSGWKLCNCNICSKIKEIKELIKQAFPDLHDLTKR